MTDLVFGDRNDPNCYLVANPNADGTVSIHGWNENVDKFTSIDLSPTNVQALANWLLSLVRTT